MKKCLLCLLLSILSASLLPGAGVNLLPSEEIALRGPGAWKKWPANTPAQIRRIEDPDADNGALQISLDKGRCSLYTTVPLSPNADYILKLRIKRTSGPVRTGRPQLQLMFSKANDPKNGSAGSFRQAPVRTRADVFQDLVFEFHTPKDAVAAQLTLVFDHMAGSCEIDSVKLERNAAAAAATTLSKGIGFESASDMGGQWFTNQPDSTEVGPSDEFAVRGKRALKVVFSNQAEGMVYFIPRETDWSRYRALKLTIHNPDSGVEFSRYRIMFRSRATGNKTFEGAPMSEFRVPRETSVTYYVELDKINKQMDFKSVSQVLLYRNPQYPDSTTFIDDVRLLTAEELENERNSKKRLQAAGLLKSVQAALAGAAPEYRPALEELLPEIERVANFKTFGKDEDAALLAIQDAAGRLATTVALLERHKNDTRNHLALFAAPSTAKIFRDMLPAAVDDDWKPELLSVRREYQAFQVVAVPEKPLSQVTVSVTPPVLDGDETCSIAPENITVNPVGYLEIYNSSAYPNSSRDGWWPDPLVHNQPLDLARQLQPYWITLFVPPDQRPGTYRGKVCFHSEDKLLNEIDFSLRVASPVLPLRNTLKTFFHYAEPVATDPEKQTELRRKGYDFFLKHRLNPISMYLNANGNPVSIPNLDDLDYCLERGLNLIDLWYLYDPAKPGFFRDDYLAEIVEFVRKVKPIYEKHGCADMLILHGFDEIMHKPAAVYRPQLQEAERITAYLRKELPDIKLSNIGRRMKIKNELMDIWWLAPIHRKTFADLQAAGKTVCFYWVYEDPSFMLDQPGIAPRLTAWLTFQQGASGMAYYSTYRPWATKCPPQTAPTGVDWSKERFCCFTKAFSQWIMDGDLLYPDTDGGYLTSIRLENLRDGIQDYELLAMLKEAEPASPLLTIPESIVTLQQGDYTRDFRVLARHRAKVIAELEKIASRQ